MGTSKGYIAPSTIKWTQAKRAVTNYLNNQDHESMGKAASKFASAMKSEVNESVAVVGAIGKLTSFANGVRNNGFDQTLKTFGREDLINKDPEEVLDALISDFTNAGATTEDFLAAQAIGEALNILGIKDLSSISDVDMIDLTVEVLSEYLKYSFSFRFSERIAKGRTIAEADAITKKMESYISNKVHSDFDKNRVKNLDLKHLESSNVVHELLRDALNIFEYFYEEA